MNQALEALILDKLQATKILDISLIQNLWSGYGELSRVTTNKGSVIAKFIKFPTERDHPRGWSSDIGHDRKKKSYQIEKHWYSNLDTVKGARMAKCFDVGHVGEHEYILLEDLQDNDFKTKHFIDWQDIESCLSWLANFQWKACGQLVPTGIWIPVPRN